MVDCFVGQVVSVSNSRARGLELKARKMMMSSILVTILDSCIVYIRSEYSTATLLFCSCFKLSLWQARILKKKNFKTSFNSCVIGIVRSVNKNVDT